MTRWFRCPMLWLLRLNPITGAGLAAAEWITASDREEDPMAGNSTESGRSVTSKITSILLTFTEGSEHSLTEIARLAELPISTAHRLTSELASWRLLERTHDGHYRAGLPLRMIGTVGSCPPSIAERAPCVLEDLSAATKSRARLGVLHDSTSPTSKNTRAPDPPPPSPPRRPCRHTPPPSAAPCSPSPPPAPSK